MLNGFNIGDVSCFVPSLHERAGPPLHPGGRYATCSREDEQKRPGPLEEGGAILANFPIRERHSSLNTDSQIARERFCCRFLLAEMPPASTARSAQALLSALPVPCPASPRLPSRGDRSSDTFHALPHTALATETLKLTHLDY